MRSRRRPAFIGPTAASSAGWAIQKAGAKLLMASHGVPVVPGYTGEARSRPCCSTKPTASATRS